MNESMKLPSSMFIQVTYVTQIKTGTETSYEISLRDEILRTTEDVKRLNLSLLQKGLLTDINEILEENVDEVQLLNYLNRVLDVFHDTIWEIDSLISFLDNNEANTSRMTNFQIKIMTSQISVLSAQSEQFKHALKDVEARSAELADLVHLLSLNAQAAVPTRLTGHQRDRQQRRLEREGNATNRSHVNSTSPRSSTSGFSVNSESSSASEAENSPCSPRQGASGSQLRVTSSQSGSDSRSRSQAVSKGTSSSDSASPGATPSPLNEVVALGDICISANQMHFADSLVAALQPHDNQLMYRHSAIGFVKKHIRIALNCSAFDAGLHELRCNLPDDPIHITTVLCRNHLSNWQTTLCDALSGDVDPTDSDSSSGDQYYELLEPEYRPLVHHVLTDATVSNDQMNYQVNGRLDGQLEVEISVNARGDLCMLAFLEEFSGLVGQDHLFKRSLLLIRAWWVYETASYVGCPIKHYLSDFSLCIMVCAIFNQYHAQIGSPLQALCLFLTEYSGYDGSTHAITLQGVAPFAASGAVTPLPPSGSHLLGAQVLERFWNIFNVAPAGVKGSALVPEESRMVQTRNRAPFTRFGFNVVHPFTGANMMAEKVSSRRVARIATVFRAGANNLVAALRGSDYTNSESEELLTSFFNGSYTRYMTRDNARPDALSQSGLSREFVRSAMAIFTAKLFQSILYCNLVTEAMLVESALLTLTSEILAEKGALPVGEVGKTLTEMTGIPNLSQKLKEKFGGLKKFLERFQDLFLFSNDHPFNPHVLLRCSVAEDQLYMIDAGYFPPTLSVKSKKRGSVLSLQPKKQVPMTASGSQNGIQQQSPRPQLSDILGSSVPPPPTHRSSPLTNKMHSSFGPPDRGSYGNNMVGQSQHYQQQNIHHQSTHEGRLHGLSSGQQQLRQPSPPLRYPFATHQPPPSHPQQHQHQQQINNGAGFNSVAGGRQGSFPPPGGEREQQSLHQHIPTSHGRKQLSQPSQHQHQHHSQESSLREAWSSHPQQQQQQQSAMEGGFHGLHRHDTPQWTQQSSGSGSGASQHHNFSQSYPAQHQHHQSQSSQPQQQQQQQKSPANMLDEDSFFRF